jgi:RND family efflux transporter MFP subunit
MKTRDILIIIFITLSASCRNTEIKSTYSEVNRVRVTGILTSEISIPVHSTGTLVSSEELKLSFKTGGIVSYINVDEGQHVNKGDMLASLDLSEITASADQAKNLFDKALRDYNRAENLYRDSVATLEQKQNAATALNVAESNLEIVKFNLRHSHILAPDKGVILKQFVKEKELVSAGYPIFLFGSSGKSWRVKASLSDKDVVKINPGDSSYISFDAYPGIKFSAVVDQVGEISNPYTGTYETELILQGKGFRLASGFVASVDIFPLLKRPLSMIPVGSVVEADGQHGYIFEVTDSMTVRKIQIDIETPTGTLVAVKGIPEGIKEIVSEGAAYLKDGMKVEVVR